MFPLRERDLVPLREDRGEVAGHSLPGASDLRTQGLSCCIAAFHSLKSVFGAGCAGSDSAGSMHAVA